MKYYIGVDLGGTNVRTLLVDEEGTILAEVKGGSEVDQGPDHVASVVLGQIESLDCSKIGGIENVEGIGLGVPGPVDTVNKVMVMSTNIPGFERYEICKMIEEKFGKPAFMDNDANVAGLAEAILGAGKKYPTVYYMTISTGIGGAFIVDGKLISGNRGHAGEIGNIIVKSNGKKYNHLNPGAVENEASGTALTRTGKELIGDEVKHAGVVFDLAASGNETAIAIKNQFIDDLSTLLANIAHTVDPHCFVIGGGMMKSKAHFFKELEAAFNSKIHVGMQGHIPLLETEIEDCGAIGAAMLPMSQLK